MNDELPRGSSGSGKVDNGLSDVEIVARVIGGNAPLYELLMRRHNQVLFRVARSVIRDDDEARDVVQAAYVEAYYHLGQLRGPAVRAWLARITLNEAFGRLRRSPKLADDDRVMALPDWEAMQPENVAIGGQVLNIIQVAIDRLPDDFRTVFMLRAVEQLTVAETAELLEIKQATVKTRFFRARRLLQEALHRTLDDRARDAFPFAGMRCDRIVEEVLARIARH